MVEYLKRRVQLLEQDLLTLPVHQSSSPVFSEMPVTLSVFDLQLLMVPLLSSNLSY